MEHSNDNERVCPNCGSSVIGHKARIYCSERCQRQHHARNYVKPPIAQSYVCQNCGEAFHPKRHDRTKFCSRECSYAFKTAVAQERAGQPKPPRTKHARSCHVCGEPFESVQASAKYCSARCSAKASAIANDNVDRSPRPCAECGVVFAPSEYGDQRKVYCSKECAKRHERRVARLRRKARMRTEEADNVDPFVVFERDGWRCYLCGVDTPRNLRGTLEPNAPELEHIIPLAKGGAHSYANTACACHACNQAKSDSLLDAA